MNEETNTKEKGLYFDNNFFYVDGEKIAKTNTAVKQHQETKEVIEMIEDKTNFKTY